ncbi:uncharacterized protein PHACADRAFT_249903 [Phanerochaete carnosa HHB-10118-sp]|uniref:Glycerophosphocholine acyltransferase 1 n=1 Tax=Phanerochaete carnosa (strain HHB-10118-sp) TaxID=650164 RepID=K5WJ70_PHACS|nr:uncharacterized protein PHACADRAFT_249903 [Phanerochaete carnosa HHB-10118-sp]EKM59425.1 hypothetical protein PHACADRAFT_249903 [Phanerochaete carnosa HHB-10118-sp]
MSTATEERASQSPLPRTESSTPNGGANHGSGYFSIPFERFVKDELSDFASGFTLLDTMETFFDSRLDLLQRNLAKQSDRLKMKADQALQGLRKDLLKQMKSQSGEVLTDNLEREMQKFKLKVSHRMTSLTASWQSAKIVRTREKISFFLGVMSLLATALMFGSYPQYIHIAYTIGTAILLPIRAVYYKKRAWHYFLFDLCYYCNILNLLYLWILPSSPALFLACYCLSHGSLASAVITWRNSLVFHDMDKVTSLFIHIYPPLTFTVIRHYYPDAATRFPALKELPHMQPFRALLLSSIIYLIWQLLYWKFVLIDRRKKIESGQRTTSFSFLLNDKRGVIGRVLSAIPPQYREPFFMLGQLGYAVLTEIPALFLLYDSPFWSGALILFIFAVSVWNGGGFYIEVFGRKFEKELEALRKELAEATSRSERSSPTLGPQSDDELSTVAGSPSLSGKGLSPSISNVELPLETIPSQTAPAPNSDESRKDR